MLRWVLLLRVIWRERSSPLESFHQIAETESAGRSTIWRWDTPFFTQLHGNTFARL
ncbi:MAG: hypothetical protein ACJAW4_003943 [Paracoccaceae bacterium]|jgi:hypothetical protein